MSKKRRRSHYETIDIIRRKASMSQQITAKGGEYEEYGYYAGASWEIARDMAFIDFLIKRKVTKGKLLKLLQFYRDYLKQQGKAFFASIGSSEISKLGWILGLETKVLSAEE